MSVLPITDSYQCSKRDTRKANVATTRFKDKGKERKTKSNILRDEGVAVRARPLGASSDGGLPPPRVHVMSTQVTIIIILTRLEESDDCYHQSVDSKCDKVVAASSAMTMT